jgi:hypothetical protein
LLLFSNDQVLVLLLFLPSFSGSRFRLGRLSGERLLAVYFFGALLLYLVLIAVQDGFNVKVSRLDFSVVANQLLVALVA